MCTPFSKYDDFGCHWWLIQNAAILTSAKNEFLKVPVFQIQIVRPQSVFEKQVILNTPLIGGCANNRFSDFSENRFLNTLKIELSILGGVKIDHFLDLKIGSTSYLRSKNDPPPGPPSRGVEGGHF